jgi:hypothetical protein
MMGLEVMIVNFFVVLQRISWPSAEGNIFVVSKILSHLTQ